MKCHKTIFVLSFLLAISPISYAIELNISGALNQAASYLSGSMGKASSLNIATSPAYRSSTTASDASPPYNASNITNGTASVADDCLRLNNVIANAASQRSTEINLNNSVSASTESRGVLDLLSMPLGANPVADAMTIAVTNAMSRLIRNKALNYLNQQLSNIQASMGNAFNGVNPLLAPIASEIQNNIGSTFNNSINPTVNTAVTSVINPTTPINSATNVVSGASIRQQTNPVPATNPTTVNGISIQPRSVNQ